MNVMYEIIVKGSFSATHRLQLKDGSWESIHGHDWRVSVCLAAEELDETGMVVDFAELRSELSDITAQLHHTDLNEHQWLENVNPTAEHVARLIFTRMARQPTWGSKLRCVQLVEAPGCVVRYVRGLDRQA